MDFITGIQPTGDLHLGNYLGAIRPVRDLFQRGLDGYVFVADLHAITSGHNPKELGTSISRLIATMVASGIPHERIFVQGNCAPITEMAWILQATAARTGWLNRMTQFREKTAALGENSEGPSVGLYTYPVLQAADILALGAKSVPVGEDQAQHLNLVLQIARKFNRDFGDTLVVPKPLVTPDHGRIMSLYDASKKMSKSDPDPNTRILLTDSPDDIARKIKKATSDTGMIPDSVEALSGRRELTNLLSIYAAMWEISLADAIKQFAGLGYGKLKPALTDTLVQKLRDIRESEDRLEPNSACETRVGEIAASTLRKTRQAIGLM